MPPPSPPPAAPTTRDAASRPTTPLPPHFDPKALMASIESGAIAALSGRFAANWRATGKPLPRRQDMPPEAFFPVAKLRWLVEALGDDWGLLFVALSYRWLTKEHPDPERFHLDIVSAVARLYLDGGRHGGLGSPLAAAFERAGLGSWHRLNQEWEGEAPDFALFWDFACLHQKPRTAEEDSLFKEGLSQLHVWYGHAQTVCWMQSELPPGFAEEMEALGLARSYEESGWCFVEAATSAGVKVGTRRLDLGKRTDLAMINFYGYPDTPPQYHLEGVCAARRQPPLLPDEVRRLLEKEKKFTTGKEDVEVVDKLYRGFFDGVAGAATSLNFSNLGWGPAEAQALVGVLPCFAALQSLDLTGNELGAEGGAHLAGYLRVSASLTSMDISNNRLCGVWDEYERGSYVPKGTYDATGINAIADALRVNASLTSVSLSNNGIGAEGGVAIAEALKANASMTAIDVSHNKIDQPSARLILEAMKGKSMQSITMAGCSLGVEEAKILAEYTRVMASLTATNVLHNKFDADAVSMLLKVMQEHTNLSTLCGFKGDETSIDFCNEGLLPVDAMLIAPEIRVMASLTSADFSQNQLGPEGVKALAPALAASASLTSVSLADNRLCGVDGDGNGTYDATGIKAIADALRVNASLTSLSLRENNIKGTGEALWEALKNNSCIKTLDLCLCSLGPEDGTGLAGGIAVSASLTEVYICGNNIRNGGAEAIANALKANDSCVLKKLAVDLGLEDHEGLKSACQLRGVELEGVE